jgi:hypothetical protein
VAQLVTDIELRVPTLHGDALDRVDVTEPKIAVGTGHHHERRTEPRRVAERRENP